MSQGLLVLLLFDLPVERHNPRSIVPDLIQRLEELPQIPRQIDDLEISSPFFPFSTQIAINARNVEFETNQGTSLYFLLSLPSSSKRPFISFNLPFITPKDFLLFASFAKKPNEDIVLFKLYFIIGQDNFMSCFPFFRKIRFR